MLFYTMPKKLIKLRRYQRIGKRQSVLPTIVVTGILHPFCKVEKISNTADKKDKEANDKGDGFLRRQSF